MFGQMKFSKKGLLIRGKPQKTLMFHENLISFKGVVAFVKRYNPR